eukprot:5806250-Amphidinium_carterae.1
MELTHRATGDELPRSYARSSRECLPPTKLNSRSRKSNPRPEEAAHSAKQNVIPNVCMECYALALTHRKDDAGTEPDDDDDEELNVSDDVSNLMMCGRVEVYGQRYGRNASFGRPERRKRTQE